MKGIFKVVVARWLARTPVGLILLGVGWLIGRKRKQRRLEQERHQPRVRRQRAYSRT
jgi:cytochrome c-type biogenesis protein CcmH/NrfF